MNLNMFGSLKNGDKFKSPNGDTVFMKLATCSAVDINDGELLVFKPEKSIIPLDFSFETSPKKFKWDDLKVGEKFKHCGNIYIKTRAVGHINSYRPNDFQPMCFAASEEVEPVP